MALKGNLKDFTTTQLLNLINLARKTGTLTVEGAELARISFKDGKLIYAEMGTQTGSLAQVLHRSGKLSSEQSRFIESKFQGKSDKQLGHRLIQSKLVTQHDIIQSIRQHVLDIVYKLFTWAEGSFQFDANKMPSANRITIPIDLESVIMEGSRRLQESERLLEELPDLDATLRFVDRPDARLRNVNLTVEEWRVISYINPKNTINQIAKANNLSEFQIRRTVYGMMQAGIVEVISPEKPEEETATTAPRRRRQQTESVAEKRNVVNRLIDRIRSL
ncbi:MAG: DUF4388 domain-containing protein [Anaerolineales bacterium]|nr:DUF4388 domain-containing protein [Anaerolineales bacterium]